MLDVSGLDLLEEAVYKATFTFTREELNALDDLKMELNRRYDAGATKYNLIRCAVHMLVEDYATKGEQAYVRRKLRKRVA